MAATKRILTDGGYVARQSEGGDLTAVCERLTANISKCVRECEGGELGAVEERCLGDCLHTCVCGVCVCVPGMCARVCVCVWMYE